MSLSLVVVMTIFSACDEPKENLDISDQWKFFKRTNNIYVTSNVDQFLLDALFEPEGSISIIGKYDYNLTQMMTWEVDSINTRYFSFYKGAPWMLAPPQLFIIDNGDTIIGEFLYRSIIEDSTDFSETFHPIDISYSFNHETGVFNLPNTTFYSDTGSGEVTIGGLIDYNTVRLNEGQSTLVWKSNSNTNSDDIDTLDFKNDGVICIYFQDKFWADTLCGQWGINGNDLTYDLSNERHREYKCSIVQDTLILREEMECNSEIYGEGLFWFSEYPNSITMECSEEVLYFYR